MKIGQKVVLKRPSMLWNKGMEGIIIKRHGDDLTIFVTKSSVQGRGIVGTEFRVPDYKCDIVGGRFGQWIKEMERNGNVKV